MTWMKDFLPEDAYNQLTSRFNNVYDSIHPPNLVLQGFNPILYEISSLIWFINDLGCYKRDV